MLQIGPATPISVIDVGSGSLSPDRAPESVTLKHDNSPIYLPSAQVDHHPKDSSKHFSSKLELYDVNERLIFRMTGKVPHRRTVQVCAFIDRAGCYKLSIENLKQKTVPSTASNPQRGGAGITNPKSSKQLRHRMMVNEQQHHHPRHHRYAVDPGTKGVSNVLRHFSVHIACYIAPSPDPGSAPQISNPSHQSQMNSIIFTKSTAKVRRSIPFECSFCVFENQIPAAVDITLASNILMPKSLQYDVQMFEVEPSTEYLSSVIGSRTAAMSEVPDQDEETESEESIDLATARSGDDSDNDEN